METSGALFCPEELIFFLFVVGAIVCFVSLETILEEFVGLGGLAKGRKDLSGKTSDSSRNSFTES